MDPYYDHKLQVFAEHCRAGNVLDYGCGQGHFSRSLAQMGWNVWGVDSNEERLEEATRKAKEQGLDDRCRFVPVATSEHSLPFEDDFFDAVFASEVIEHLPDLLTFIVEIKRVLPQGGSLYLTTPNGVSYRHVTKNLLWRAKSRIPEIESWPQYLPGKEGHIYYWDLWTLYRLFNINGFRYLGHDYGEKHNVFRKVSGVLSPIKPLRTGLFLALEHEKPDLVYR